MLSARVSFFLCCIEQQEPACFYVWLPSVNIFICDSVGCACDSKLSRLTVYSCVAFQVLPHVARAHGDLN